MKLIRYELFKLAKSKALLIVLSVSIVFYCLLCGLVKPDLRAYTFDTKLYKMYIEQYSGTFSQRTLEQMRTELENLREQASETLENKAFTIDEYNAASKRIFIASQKSQALGAVIERYEQLSGDRQLVYDLELDAYSNGYLKKLGLLLCLAAVTFVTIKAALDDDKCRMEGILFTTSCGRRRLLTAKTVTVLGLTVLIALLFSLADLLIIGNSWDFGDTALTLQSFKGFEKSTLNISMKTALRLSAIIKIAVFAMYSQLLTLFARLIKNDIAAVAITLVTSGICFYPLSLMFVLLV